MKKKSNTERQESLNLTIVSAITIFVILLLSILIAALIVYLLFHFHILEDYNEITLIRSLVILGIISFVIGATISSIFSTQLISPFKVLNKAMNSLAKGDFDTRVKIRGVYNLALFKSLSLNFNNMAERLGTNEMLRKNFINDFSHEFKTPIVSLKGFAKILKNKDLSEDERNEYLDIIISEADRLSILSKNVLTLNKVENETLLTDIVEYNITEQIRSAIILLQNKWSEKNIQLNIDLDECSFSGNEELLSLVWINLIDNSIKFVKENGMIQICLKANTHSIKFVLKDNGIGMSEEEVSKIYEKFYQADSSHSTEGNGIGLTLVSQIVRLHQGLITCESKKGVGTTFVVTLPNREEVL